MYRKSNHRDQRLGFYKSIDKSLYLHEPMAFSNSNARPTVGWRSKDSTWKRFLWSSGGIRIRLIIKKTKNAGFNNLDLKYILNRPILQKLSSQSVWWQCLWCVTSGPVEVRDSRFHFSSWRDVGDSAEDYLKGDRTLCSSWIRILPWRTSRYTRIGRFYLMVNIAFHTAKWLDSKYLEILKVVCLGQV